VTRINSQHLKWIEKVHQSCPKTRTGIVFKRHVKIHVLGSTLNFDYCKIL